MDGSPVHYFQVSLVQCAVVKVSTYVVGTRVLARVADALMPEGNSREDVLKSIDELLVVAVVFALVVEDVWRLELQRGLVALDARAGETGASVDEDVDDHLAEQIVALGVGWWWDADVEDVEARVVDLVALAGCGVGSKRVARQESGGEGVVRLGGDSVDSGHWLGDTSSDCADGAESSDSDLDETHLTGWWRCVSIV